MDPLEPTDLLERVRRGVARLAQLDRRFLVPGSSHHRHRFRPPLDAAALAACEARHGFRLPAGPRAVYTTLGNGGAGPSRGLVPLDLRRPLPAGLSRPFRPPAPPGDGPYRSARVDADRLAALDGTMLLCDHGGGVELRLVLNGPAGGQVWWRLESGDLAPVTDGEQGPVGFEAWYLGWLDAQLALFEALVELLGARSPHAMIHAALDPRYLAPVVDQALLSLLDCTGAGCAHAQQAQLRWLARRIL